MREKIWGGLILITASLSISLNIYTLIKQKEKFYNFDNEIPAKPVSYIEEEKTLDQDKKEIKNLVKAELKEIKNLKLGRMDPFEPLIKEEKEEKIISPKIVYTSNIKYEEKKELLKEPPYLLRGILEGDKKLVILETKDENRSFVLEEGDKIEGFKLEKVNSLERKIILKDSKGNTFTIRM
ncbi:MAG: hypothetical protein NZ841_05305 [Dictyoglomus sp.]|nr:hypothetical protein [Dictyoglomus sp.]MCX7942073.1 hypothetical protein [Dictyoglomaceae bacterium]MDW8188696.1 hypothetical protein [Dictyoglomus sp.]